MLFNFNYFSYQTRHNRKLKTKLKVATEIARTKIYISNSVTPMKLFQSILCKDWHVHNHTSK